MQITSFLDHWKLRENPFLAEEARQDRVFTRLPDTAGHPDFDKILGDLERPATSIVFGEKGSGKTAIRLQIEGLVRKHNESVSGSRTLLIPYDDLNPILDRYVRRARAKSTDEALEKLRLVDHIDGLLGVAVPGLVSAALGDAESGPAESANVGNNAISDLGSDVRSRLRKADRATKIDWLLLQSLYDQGDQVVERGKGLRRALRFLRPSWVRPIRWLTLALWVATAAVSASYVLFFHESGFGLGWVAFGVLAVVTLLASYQSLSDFWWSLRQSRRLFNQLRVLDRSRESFRSSLERLPSTVLAQANLPVDDLDDPRYELLQRLLRAVAPLGFTRAMVLVDRVDEPTLVNGDTARMRAVVWPLFNNKFLQQAGFSFKMLLPLELRHELHRQSADFFQEARMDKQNMIDRLTWSGTTLYDLCNVRLNACRDEEGDRLSLGDLFEEDVTTQEVVDALDQMRQPRDAFKMMYQVIQEHCRNTTEEDARWRIPRLTLDKVRRNQSDRLEALQRGLGPA